MMLYRAYRHGREGACGQCRQGCNEDLATAVTVTLAQLQQQQALGSCNEDLATAVTVTPDR